VRMIQTWQLQEAKNKLSRVVENAISSGPQIITRRGEEVVIVLSYAEYKRMVASRQKLSEFFRESPLVGIDLDLSRDKSEARNDIQL
jgi:antitoxin Phd